MDPTLKMNTVAALKAGISKFSPQMRTAAKYVVDNPSAFGLDSIRETARKAGVSTYTIVNMSKSLGFPSYEAFRLPFRDALVSGAKTHTDHSWVTDIPNPSEFGTVYAKSAQNALAIVTESLERLQLEELEAISERLICANTVYLTAARSSYAVAFYLHYVGRMALPSLQLIPRHHNIAIDELNDAQAGDVLIAITVAPYSRETIEACTFAKKKGVSLLLITDSEVVAPDLDPEHRLISSVLSPHSFGCLSGMMAVVEVLLAFLMKRGGDAAQGRLNAYEEMRAEQNIYWSAQKNISFSVTSRATFRTLL